MTKSISKSNNHKKKSKQLKNKHKQLIQREKQKERKARTRRLIERGAILESYFDNPKLISNDEIKDILNSFFYAQKEKETSSQE